MGTLSFTLAIIVAVGLVYVLVPLALEAYMHFRNRTEVVCPATMDAAFVQVDARHAAATAVLGRTEFAVLECSKWPERRSCERLCTNQMAR